MTNMDHPTFKNNVIPSQKSKSNNIGSTLEEYCHWLITDISFKRPDGIEGNSDFDLTPGSSILHPINVFASNNSNDVDPKSIGDTLVAGKFEKLDTNGATGQDITVKYAGNYQKSGCTSGNVLLEYLPPHPARSNPKITHRFMFYLLEQVSIN